MFFEVEAAFVTDPWAVVGVIATVAIGVAALAVAIVVPSYIYKRQSPKRELWYSVSAYSLLPFNTPELSARLTVQLDGKPVENPYISTFHLWSTGRADIPSSDFDAGKPLIFNLGTNFLSVVGMTEKEDQSIVRIQEDGVLAVPSALIRKNYASEIRVITDGPPNSEVVVSNPLVDIEVSRVEDLEAQLRRTARYGWVKFVVVLAVIPLSVIVVPALKVTFPWSLSSIVLMIASVAWLASDALGNRASRLRKAFQRSL